MAATGSFITPRCAGANLVIRLLKEGAALPTTWAVLIGIIFCLFVSACLQFSVEFTVETADTPKTPVTTGEGTMLVGMLSLWFYAFVRRNGRWIWEPVNWGLGREGVEGMCVSCACVDWHYYLPPSGGHSIQLCGCQVHLFLLLIVCLLSVVSRAELERQVNGRRDAPDYLCGASWARSSSRRVPRGCFGDATSNSRGRLCLCLWLTSCLHLYVHHLMRSCLLFVCAYVLALSPGTALTQSASALVPEGADGGAARAPPCPPNTRSC